MTTVACGEQIRQGDGECCEKCFTEDTHGLLDPVPDKIERLTNRIEMVENHLLAEMVVLRTDLMDAVRLAGEATGRLREALNKAVSGVEERLMHFDHDQAVVDFTFLDTRLDEVEECIEGLEKHLKLRRKPKDLRYEDS